MPTLPTISRAFVGPMPWMYWSATTTRLLVGMLTPAIRATRACLLHAKEREPRARPPAPLREMTAQAPARRSRPLAEGSPYRDQGWRVNGFGLSEARRCPSPHLTSPRLRRG